MKKLLLILIVLCPMAARADNRDTKYTWSYGALGDTMKKMRNNCEITSADEFIEMGNWFREKAATFSFNELKTQCETQKHKFREIDRMYKDENGNIKKCEMPLPCDGKKCSEIQYTNNLGCNIFITEFIKNNNIRAKILDNKTPGTYVKKVKLTNGETAYKIVDVILANGYWENNRINQDINTNVANTKIYDISTGNILDTGMHTWTNDMFFDVSASTSSRGDVRGAFVNSYIRPEIDLTQEIYALYDNGRGVRGNSLGDAGKSRPKGPYDIKIEYGKKYKVGQQKDTETHANGVMFKDKIVTLDFLGNLLFGMNNQEASSPNFVGRGVAQGVSIVHGVASPIARLAPSEIVFHVEPQHVKQAWAVGEEIVRDDKPKRIMTFAKIQTKTEQEAYQKAAQEMKKIYSDSQGISCTGNCNKRPGSDDVVICTDSSKRRLEFVFDDICHGRKYRLWPFSEF